MNQPDAGTPPVDLEAATKTKNAIRELVTEFGDKYVASLDPEVDEDWDARTARARIAHRALLSVTDALIDEHAALIREVERLRAALTAWTETASDRPLGDADIALLAEIPRCLNCGTAAFDGEEVDGLIFCSSDCMIDASGRGE